MIDVVEKVSPSVVTIHGVRLDRYGSHAVAKKGMGSGVIIDSKGYILTNHHVVRGAHKLRVELSDGRKVPANVVGSKPALDIAVIKAEAGGLPAAELGDSDRLKIGQLVIAIGKPFGFTLESTTVTAGIVSSLGQRFVGEVAGYGSGSGVSEASEGWIQTDAAINQGNSGGPLVDERGFVVGINTRGIVGDVGESVPGMNFAIPINVARKVAERFIRPERPARF